MSAAVFSAVLVAALLHAGWNALVKTNASKQTAMLILTLGHALIGAAVVAARPLPAAGVWPWLLASGLVHTAYQLFLAHAYEQGDLSRVYPIARGAAPLIVALAGAALLPDAIARTQYLGILVLGAGILAMSVGALRAGESRRLVPYALGSAMATAGYSLTDGIGARLSGDPAAFSGWLFILAALFYTPAVIALRGTVVLRAAPRTWALGLLAASGSYAAYAIVVWAMTEAPIALVAALRETSILFAVLIGRAAFGERMGRGKLMAAALIVAGVALTRL